MKILFNVDFYTVENLINLLLPKLQQRGVKKITEEELSKDLYYYYQQPKFKDLFINMVNKISEEKLDIYDAIFVQKYIANTIKCDDLRPTKLFLSYPEDFDFSYGESLLTKEGLLLVTTMADELSAKYKVESFSKNIMSIYNIEPNQNYTLVNGTNRFNLNVSWILLTDGDVKTHEQIKIEKDFLCSRPRNLNENVKLNSVDVRKINIEKASYVVMQGFENDVIKSLKVYTNLTDLESLQQISQIANNTSHENEKILLEDRPVVKKIVLS